MFNSLKDFFLNPTFIFVLILFIIVLYFTDKKMPGHKKYLSCDKKLIWTNKEKDEQHADYVAKYFFVYVMPQPL